MKCENCGKDIDRNRYVKGASITTTCEDDGKIHAPIWIYDEDKREYEYRPKKWLKDD